MTRFFKMAAIALSLILPATSQAGVFADDLSRCLVNSSSEKDKEALVVWMFTAIARHPSVAGMSSVSTNDFVASNQSAADTIVNLMAEVCREETKKAIENEGESAIEKGFAVFGQVAAQRIFSHPDVAAGMSELEKYVDGDKLAEALGKN